MKKPRLSVFLLAVLLNWAVAPAALAYFPPLQDVTGPNVDQSGGVTRITFSVHDPATGQDVSYEWDADGGADTVTVDQTQNFQGMVTWRVHYLSDDSYQVFCAVFDPNRAAWFPENPEWGWQIVGTWEKSATELNIKALCDGMFIYENHYTTSGQTYNNIFFCAYDPTTPTGPEAMMYGWMVQPRSHPANSVGAIAQNFIAKDGVGAYTYDNAIRMHMVYVIYDASSHLWHLVTDYPTNPTGAPAITYATLTYTDATGPQKRGYDYTDGLWHSGLDTKLMPYFVYGPLAPKAGQLVWFTDASIAGVSWTYDIFEEGFSTNERSFYFIFARPGSYRVEQQAIGVTEILPFRRILSIPGGSIAALLLLMVD